MSVLSKCAVVMADPPWDIHMELPYGTMQDDEMRKLDVPSLQDEGYIFLWVTGRYLTNVFFLILLIKNPQTLIFVYKKYQKTCYMVFLLRC